MLLWLLFRCSHDTNTYSTIWLRGLIESSHNYSCMGILIRWPLKPYLLFLLPFFISIQITKHRHTNQSTPIVARIIILCVPCLSSFAHTDVLFTHLAVTFTTCQSMAIFVCVTLKIPTWGSTALLAILVFAAATFWKSWWAFFKNVSCLIETYSCLTNCC